ncbi:MAG: DNA-binding response regulator [Campylobacteraceae bacterium 4484_4]|nr:MAG: DNA-binding response regulator [Campylobacteraceae bacterium 4484_4]
MIKILMIEDDAELAEILTEYLAQFDMEITNVEDPYIGLSTLDTGTFDLVILDLTLPGMDGLDVCNEIRKRYAIPIIISSARHDITDKVEALERGADDYIPKPYNPRELQARIKSLLRRDKHHFASAKQKQKEQPKDIVLKKEAQEILFKGKPLHLTQAEYGILKYLLSKEGSVVSREELIYNVDAISEESTNKSIDVIIGRIRHKLGETPKNAKYIHSVRGVGYKFTQ